MKRPRPPLHEIPLKQAMNAMLNGTGELVITMSVDHWDRMIEQLYMEEHAILLELNDDEKPVRAYQRSIEQELIQ